MKLLLAEEYNPLPHQCHHVFAPLMEQRKAAVNQSRNMIYSPPVILPEQLK